ncbi:MAG: H-NS histone family protein [Gammaproteobacteria bacterium]|nr:H-NS histone family protein [Gammaproteobacteria bacterium]
MAKVPNVSNLTLEQIQKLKTDLNKEETRKKRSQKSRLVTQLAGEIRKSGFTVEEIANDLLQKKSKAPVAKRAGTRRGSVNVAYIDPEDPNNTWTFKGRAPKWVEERMQAAGLDIKNREHKEQFRKKLKKA